jgi:hypothetical protein
VCRWPRPQIGLLRGQLPPRARSVIVGHEAAGGVDQRPVSLATPVLGLFPEVGTDDIVQYHLVRVVAVVANQSQLGQALAIRRV